MTKTLIAKPIINDQYWVVIEGDKKVGNVLAEQSGFDVRINGHTFHYETTDEISKFTQIKFENNKHKTTTQLPYPDYPTTSRVYNSMFDIKRKLHLFTKSRKSKCYHAAGWFAMNTNNNKQVIFCPKYIFIQRYNYSGPYKTEDEAQCAINIL